MASTLSIQSVSTVVSELIIDAKKAVEGLEALRDASERAANGLQDVGNSTDASAKSLGFIDAGRLIQVVDEARTAAKDIIGNMQAQFDKLVVLSQGVPA